MLINEALKKVMVDNEIKDQEELARVLGVVQGTISNYMNGKITLPNIKVAAKIYKIFGIRVEPYTETGLQRFIDEGGLK